jgi:DHA2 family multidrug resistance protein
MRQLGGSIGIALSANAVARFSAQARAALAAHLPANDPGVLARIDLMARGLTARGTPAAQAHEAALRALAGQVQAQAAMLAFERIFILFGVAFLLAVPLILSLRWRPGTQATADAH